MTPNIVDVSSAVDRQQLKALLQTAMGSNYYMVHGKREWVTRLLVYGPGND